MSFNIHLYYLCKECCTSQERLPSALTRRIEYSNSSGPTFWRNVSMNTDQHSKSWEQIWYLFLFSLWRLHFENVDFDLQLYIYFSYNSHVTYITFHLISCWIHILSPLILTIITEGGHYIHSEMGEKLEFREVSCPCLYCCRKQRWDWNTGGVWF